MCTVRFCLVYCCTLAPRFYVLVRRGRFFTFFGMLNFTRFDAEQRGLMTDSGAVEDSLLDGFADPWPRPRYAASASAAAVAKRDEGLPASLSPPASTATAAVGASGDPLVLPDGVLLKHAVQVWNALCVFPRPMGLRPPPTLDQLMRAIVTLSPRWSNGPGKKAGCIDGGRGGYVKEGEGGDEGGGEAEFDDKNASIRGVRGKKGNGGGADMGNVEGSEETKKEAQALLDGVCMSIVRVLSIDLHTVLGR